MNIFGFRMGGLDCTPYDKTVFQFHRLFGMWIICEKHIYPCKCSYCKYFPKGFHLILPEDKRWDSWRILYFKTKMKAIYLRWILPRPKMICLCVELINSLHQAEKVFGPIDEYKENSKTEQWLERWARR